MLPGEQDEDHPPLLDVKLDASYTAAGDTEFGGAGHGDSDAFNLNFSATTLVPLGEKWFMPFEVQSQNFALDEMSGFPPMLFRTSSMPPGPEMGGVMWWETGATG